MTTSRSRGRSTAGLVVFPAAARVGVTRRWAQWVSLLSPEARSRALAPLLAEQLATLIRIGIPPAEATAYADALEGAVLQRLAARRESGNRDGR